MKTIKLTQNREAIVDDADFERINKLKWFYDGRYAARKSPKKVYMHKIIHDSAGRDVTDHINRNTLDNRRCNLRTTTRSQNGFNSKLPTHNTSGHKGVTWYARDKTWQAQIKFAQRVLFLGRFRNKKDAIAARKAAELKLWSHEDKR